MQTEWSALDEGWQDEWQRRAARAQHQGPSALGRPLTSRSPSHNRCSAAGKPVSALSCSLSSRTVPAARSANVLQPAQPGSTVTRSHLRREGSGQRAGPAPAPEPGLRPRATCPPLRPGPAASRPVPPPAQLRRPPALPGPHGAACPPGSRSPGTAAQQGKRQRKPGRRARPAPRTRPTRTVRPGPPWSVATPPKRPRAPSDRPDSV